MPPSPTTDGRSHPARGLGIDAGAEQAPEPSARDSGPPGKETMTKLNQIISVCDGGVPCSIWIVFD